MQLFLFSMDSGNPISDWEDGNKHGVLVDRDLHYRVVPDVCATLVHGDLLYDWKGWVYERAADAALGWLVS